VDIVVTGRHLDIPARLRAHAEEKLGSGKVEKLCPKAIRVDVELSREKNPRLAQICHRIELTCVSRGPVIRAEAAADDVISAFDLAWTKLEARLRKAADRRHVHHGARTPISVATAAARWDAAYEFETDRVGRAVASAENGNGNGGGNGGGTELLADADQVDGPMVVREKLHAASPMTLDQALYEMELVGHDFFLFADQTSGLPSVVYRRRGYDYGVIRIDTRLAAESAPAAAAN
jgi:ribosomal subunit interface protein